MPGAYFWCGNSVASDEFHQFWSCFARFCQTCWPFLNHIWWPWLNLHRIHCMIRTARVSLTGAGLDHSWKRLNGGPLQSRSGRKKSHHVFLEKGWCWLNHAFLMFLKRCTMCEGWSLIHPIYILIAKVKLGQSGPTKEGLRRFTGHRWFCPLSLTWWATQTLDQIN